METNWASDHLQTIRTLMERSALYRRALAPVMMVSGALGLAGAFGAWAMKLETHRAFGVFWLGIGVLTVAVSFLLVRKQAIRDAEPIWSLPTRRVTLASLPALLAGLAGGVHVCLQGGSGATSTLAAAWIIAYGCALQSAGFFMQRGMKLFGWGCLGGGCAVLIGLPAVPLLQSPQAAHCLMGLFFGVLHLAYGVYLHFTEKQRTAF